jgi:hypothetical protein
MEYEDIHFNNSCRICHLNPGAELGVWVEAFKISPKILKVSHVYPLKLLFLPPKKVFFFSFALQT